MYRIIKNSIKVRMIVIISLLIFLLVTGSSYFTYNTSRQILEDTLERTAIDAANKNAVILSDKLLKSINAIKNLDITTIKDREHIIDSLDQQILLKLYWGKAREGLKEFVENVDYLETIFVTDTNGNYTDILNNKGNIPDGEFFQKVFKSEEIILSKPIRMNEEDVIVILRPIIIKDKIRLILGGTIGLDYLNQITSTMNINGYGYAWVIDNEMNTIVHPNKDYHGNKSNLENNQQLLEIAEEMSAGRNGENTFTVSGEKQKITFAPVESTNWSLALTASNDMLLAPLSKVRNSSILIVFFAIIFGVVLIYFIAVSIAKPILKLTMVTEKVASGDLTQKISNFNISNEDEIGRLSNSIKKMLTNLREMIGKISNLSNQVASSSTSLAATGEQVGDMAGQVGSAIQNVAAGAEGQAVQVENTVANVTNLINRIDEINDGSNTMNEAAVNVMNDIKNGNESINYSVENINNVKTSSGEVAGIINYLGETSTEIDNIVNVINGIASQTNLLALNAAIEAARAGSAGQGFSVVADEIRKLAEESAGATEEIKVLISKIQKSVNNAIVKMDNNNKIVDKSVDVIYQTGEIFNKIEHEAVNLKARTGKIAKNTQEMTNVSKKVNKAINDIIVLSKQFASNSEEVAASSEEQIAATEEIVSRAKNLDNISEELTHSIDQFKL